VPFLDYRLVEFVFNLPDTFKLQNGVTKRVLRRGMQGIVPEKILKRVDKKGFLTAEEYWMKGPQTGEFAERINETIALAGNIIRPAMRDVLSRVVAGKGAFSHHVWRVICFGAWLKQFGVRV
jgi:asparagine synthase (glutamine-hydrolysing)